MSKRNIYVFDIETVPDVESGKRLLNIDSDNENYIMEKIVEYHIRITNGANSFPRQLFHKVIAISYVEAEEANGTLNFKRIVSNKSDVEPEIIKGFFSRLFNNSALPKLVSFNGRTFDIPTLKYRAMKHNIQIPELYMNNNYNYRYSDQYHCDLIEILSDFGASARVKMNEVCAVLSLPGKTGIDGSDVVNMYQAGHLQSVKDYCETDVLNTYLIYLKLTYHRGGISKDVYNENIKNITEYLKENPKESFTTFLNEWMEITNSNPFID